VELVLNCGPAQNVKVPGILKLAHGGGGGDTCKGAVMDLQCAKFP